MTTIRGYDRRARKVSFWVFLSLSLLLGVMTALYGTLAHALACFGFGAFCFVLWTRFWYAFYPVLFLALGASILLAAVPSRDLSGIVSGVLSVLFALCTAMSVARERRGGFEG